MERWKSATQRGRLRGMGCRCCARGKSSFCRSERNHRGEIRSTGTGKGRSPICRSAHPYQFGRSRVERGECCCGVKDAEERSACEVFFREGEYGCEFVEIN